MADPQLDADLRARAELPPGEWERTGAKIQALKRQLPAIFCAVAVTWKPAPRGNDFIEQFMPGCFRRTIDAFRSGRWDIPLMFRHGFDTRLPGTIGEVVLLQESTRGAEVMFSLPQDTCERVCELIGDQWYCSIMVMYHGWMTRLVKSPVPDQRPVLEIHDCISVELSIVKKSAAGANSLAVRLDQIHSSQPQGPLHVANNRSQP